MSEAGMRRTRELRALSRKLLVEGDVAVIIGYRDGVWQNTTRPCFATSPEATQHLVWNHHCVNNLTVYLTRPEIRRLGRPAVVVKGCDSRALDVLAREHQIARDDVVVVGMVCDGVIDSRHGVDGTRLLPKCERCTVATPPRVDHLVGDPGPARAQLPPDRSALDRIEALSTEERWRYWQAELERCLKCYACRAVCPLCYCERCFVEQTRPAWTSSSQTPRANFVFHLFRAFHLAGRCVLCGECARVCPQDIPLDLLNQKMAEEAADLFGFVAGEDPEAAAPLLTFTRDDPQEFIR
jgi:formate dehydrogenase subunit beta